MWIILIAICYFRSWWVMFRFIQIHISSLKILIHVNHYRYVSILFFVAVRINIGRYYYYDDILIYHCLMYILTCILY